MPAASNEGQQQTLQGIHMLGAESGRDGRKLQFALHLAFLVWVLLASGLLPLVAKTATLPTLFNQLSDSTGADHDNAFCIQHCSWCFYFAAQTLTGLQASSTRLPGFEPHSCA